LEFSSFKNTTRRLNIQVQNEKVSYILYVPGIHYWRPSRTCWVWTFWSFSVPGFDTKSHC